MNPVSPESIQNINECKKCFTTDAEVYIDVRNTKFVRSIYNLVDEHQNFLLCISCLDILNVQYDEGALGSLTWDLSIQSASSDGLSGGPHSPSVQIKPGPKSYKRRMAQEHGLPDIPDEAVDEYSQELMDLLLELPAIQQRAKRTRKNNTRGSSNPNGLSRTSSSIASSTTTNHIGFESVSSNEAAVSIRSYGNNDEEPIPNVNLPVALSSDSDLVPGSNSATNSYISMAAPRRIRSNDQRDHELLLKRVSGG